MKFFIPLVEEDAQAEGVIAAASRFTGHPIPSPRIYSIAYKHNGKSMKATVGESPNLYYHEEGPVICILGDETLYAVCTKNRGVGRGEPILVGRRSVLWVIHFDPA